MSDQPSILELLAKVGISESDWLLFGKIWREYGSKDPQGHRFIREINTIIPLDLNCEDAAEVANMEVPTMKFYKDGFKLHRRDVALAIVKLTPATKLLTQKDRQTFLYEFEECLNQRFPTRSGMEEYQVETTREFFKNKHKNTTAIH